MNLVTSDAVSAWVGSSSTKSTGIKSLARMGRPDIGLAGRFGGAFTALGAAVGVNIGIQGETCFRASTFTESSVSSISFFLCWISVSTISVSDNFLFVNDPTPSVASANRCLLCSAARRADSLSCLSFLAWMVSYCFEQVKIGQPDTCSCSNSCAAALISLVLCRMYSKIASRL